MKQQQQLEESRMRAAAHFWETTLLPGQGWREWMEWMGVDVPPAVMQVGVQLKLDDLPVCPGPWSLGSAETATG